MTSVSRADSGCRVTTPACRARLLRTCHRKHAYTCPAPHMPRAPTMRTTPQCVLCVASVVRVSVRACAREHVPCVSALCCRGMCSVFPVIPCSRYDKTYRVPCSGSDGTLCFVFRVRRNTVFRVSDLTKHGVLCFGSGETPCFVFQHEPPKRWDPWRVQSGGGWGGMDPKWGGTIYSWDPWGVQGGGGGPGHGSEVGWYYI